MEHLVLIDVNSTLICDGDTYLDFTDDFKEKFSKLINELSGAGVTVGLCSDSPLEQLGILAREIGLHDDAPIFAENGNLFFDGTDVHIFRTLEEDQLAELKANIKNMTSDFDTSQAADVVAPEFLGKPIDLDHQWAFGAGRFTSMSAFGSEEFIEFASYVVTSFAQENGLDLGVDCSPEEHFLGVHPVANFRHGKKLAIHQFWGEQVAHGEPIKSIWMIGDSMSDRMGTENPNIHSLFVANPRLDANARAGAFHISTDALDQGVLDCLVTVQRSLSLGLSLDH